MALEMISRDLRMAGVWGCASDVTNVVNNLDTVGGGYIDFGGGGIQGTDNGGLNNSDSLDLLGGFNSGAALLPPYGPLNSSPLNLAPGNGLQQDDIVFISDCESADIFQVTNADPDGTGSVEHQTGGSSDPGNVNVSNPGCAGPNAHCLSKIYGADATIFSAQRVRYTIANGSENEPALFRNGAEFIDGIEDLQVLFGEDTDGDFIANYYVPATQIADMGSVVSIRFAVVARSYDTNLTNGANQGYAILGAAVTAPDTRLRQVYTSTVTVRNRL